MKKVLIIGSGGSGKTTLAERLGEKTGIKVIHLDTLYWQPNWVRTDNDEWNKTIAELIAGDEWIMDGNYSRTMELRIAAADTVIFLDLPRTVCLWRVVKRAVRYYGKNRPDMAEGCNEKLDFEFVSWIWNYPKRTRPKAEALLEKFKDRLKVIRLISVREVEEMVGKIDAHKK
jgi:adenylate kinase family enzyme